MSKAIVIKKKRSDAGTKRIARTQESERVTLYLPGHGIGPKIAKAIESSVIQAKRKDPTASVSSVLIEWLSDYLGITS